MKEEGAIPIRQQPPRPDFGDVSNSRRRNLAAVRSRNTLPELIVRRFLHSLGFRYRLHRKDLPGCPDIVMPGRHAIIEVRGCFWHRHPDPACKNAVLPRTRTEWWAAKLDRNVERDVTNQAALEAAGWNVLVLWECEIYRDRQKLTEQLQGFLGPKKEKRRWRPGGPPTPVSIPLVIAEL